MGCLKPDIENDNKKAVEKTRSIPGENINNIQSVQLSPYDLENRLKFNQLTTNSIKYVHFEYQISI